MSAARSTHGREMGMARCRRPARALVATLTVAVVVALGVPVAAAKTAPAPAGYTTTVIKPAGITIAIPDGWLKIDPKSQASADALRSAADKNPQLSGLLTQFEQIRGSIKYWVIDASASQFARNLLILPTPFDKAILKQPDTVKQNLQSSLGTNVDSLSVKKVKIAKTRALEADATLKLNGANGAPISAYATLFFLATKRGVMDLDYTSTQPAASDKTLKTMLKSLQIN
jgi:hypothetical protein